MKNLNQFILQEELINNFIDRNKNYTLGNPFQDDYYISYHGGYFEGKLYDTSIEYIGSDLQVVDCKFNTFEETEKRLDTCVQYLMNTRSKYSFISTITKQDLRPTKQLYPIAYNLNNDLIAVLECDYGNWSNNKYQIINYILSEIKYKIKEKQLLTQIDFNNFKTYIDQSENIYHKYYIFK